MKIFYRISDASFNKMRLPGATKEYCLDNFTQTFGRDLHVIADNCGAGLLDLLDRRGLRYETTALGNAQSFLHALDLACDQEDDELVYFVEDDYLHLPAARGLLTEGIMRADYVTLYDHPNKYGLLFDNGEVSKVFRTKTTHWRYTSETTMTFAARAKTLKRDKAVWRKWCDGYICPNDHELHKDLSRIGRTLAVCIPGAACHTDMTCSDKPSPSIEDVENWMEPWAVAMMLRQTKKGLAVNDSLRATIRIFTRQKPSRLKQLIMLAALNTESNAPSN